MGEQFSMTDSISSQCSLRERLFSKLQLVRYCLRNQSSQTTLESLLMFARESPKDGFDEIIFERFVDELKIKHPKMRIKL